MKAKLILIAVLIGLISVMLSAETQPANPDSPSTAMAIPASALRDQALTDVLATPVAAPMGPKDLLQEYELEMAAVAQKFSATLEVIAQAVQRGQLTTEQGQELSAEQYHLAKMQFEVLSAWREMLQQDLAQVPTAPAVANPAAEEHSEIVMVALPFSSFELSPSLAEYLSLNQPQIQAIEQVMARERHALQPLMTQLQTAKEKLLAANTDRANEKQIKTLAETQASLLSKLIVANARMQAKIYKLLTPEQQRKLEEFKRSTDSPTIANN